jgi:hypothetical protein
MIHLFSLTSILQMEGGAKGKVCPKGFVQAFPESGGEL